MSWRVANECAERRFGSAARKQIIMFLTDKASDDGSGKIGEDRSERLDIVPAQLRVIVTVRPKYACRTCTDGVTQAPAPSHLIMGGLPTEATLAHVLVSKYADHLSALTA